MEFQQGVFLKFRLTSKLHLGSVQVDLPEGAVIEFDGMTVKWGGASYNVPAVKGAVAAGWLVPVEDNVSRYIPKPAGVRVRPTTGENTKEAMEVETSSDEEEVVGSYKDTMDRRREEARVAAASSMESKVVVVPDETIIEEVPEFHPTKSSFTVSQQLETTPKKYAVERDPADTEVSTRGAHGFNKTAQAESEEDAGVPVMRFKTSAVQKTVLDSEAKVMSEIKRLENQSVKVEKLVKPATHAEGEDIKSRKGDASGDVAEARSGMELEELLPDAISTGKPKIDWDMDIHWRKRIAKALTYTDRPETLKQILAVEAPKVADFLRAELKKLDISI